MHKNEHKITHGETGTPTYETWKGMMKRCYNENHIAFRHYGGRGIKVCEKWHKYINFKNDMGTKPDNLSIDRIDNDGNYTPDNCRWATMKEQSYNRRNNKRLTYKGMTKTLYQWAESVDMDPHTFTNRIRNGWSIEKALFHPVGPCHNPNGNNGR